MTAEENSAQANLLVADSFRVRSHRGVVEARGFTHHLARFTSHVARLAPEAELNAFITESVARIAAYGEGNPRLELWGGPRRKPALRLSLRPLPTLGESLTLRTAPDVATICPRQKGPNIPLFTQLNRELEAEALLVDATGYIIEGATTALIWWDGDVGHYSAQTDRVASVTELLVRTIAANQNIEFSPAHTNPQQLSGFEVWGVNALHGIRPVTSLDGAPLSAPDPYRLRSFQEALDRAWIPVLIN